MLLLLMYAAYSLLFLCLHVGLKLLRYGIRRLRGHGQEGSGADAGFAWEYFLLLGLLMTNAFHLAFGYKRVGVTELTWLMSRGPVVQALLFVAAWGLLFLLFRFLAAHWRTALGSVLAERSAIAFALVASLSCVVQPGPHKRIATEGTAFAAGPLVDPTVEPAPRRPLVFVGLDGVDWRLLRAAIRTGRLENFEELVRDGYTSSLDNGGLGLSPVVWTAIATGKSMEEHGIFGFDVSRSPLFERPIEAWLRYSPLEFAVWPTVGVLRQLGLVESRLAMGTDRHGPSMWQILSRHNYRNLVVNYMTSFPAEKINGVFLAEHAYVAMAESGAEKSRTAANGATEGMVYPVGFLEREYSHIRPAARGPQDPTSRHEREFDYLAPLTLEILKRNSFDFITFYTWLTDSFNHGLSVEDYDAMIEGRFDRPMARRFLDVYDKIDDFVAELRRLRPHANLMIVSDHGVGPGYERRRRNLQHGSRPGGIFIAHGPDVRPGIGSAPISMYDITPTVLFYFDVPVARDFRGRIATEVFSVSSAPRYVASYDPLVPNARVETSRGELAGVRERLKALGYIE